MRAVVQRVKEASIVVEGKEIANIGRGIVVLLGIAKDDSTIDMEYIADKCTNLRIFEDEDDVMNISVQDIGGEILLISQFTLYGDARRGRRPSYTEAAAPEIAKNMFETCIDIFKDKHNLVQTGEFQARMDVSLINDGPVTILLDSKKEF